MTELDALVDLQEHDLALDRFRHRLATLPERDEVATAEATIAKLDARATEVRSARDVAAAEESRYDDEARRLADQAAAAEARLYSGEVSSPRELQALQADIEQLKRHQRSVEDKQLGAMEQREPLDAELASIEADVASSTQALDAARRRLEASAAAIGADMTKEAAARAEVASRIDPDLIADYERCREKANGIGAARLVGMTCQGCHLSIPATEVDRIRRSPAGSIDHCDNCGAILIP
jgi:uncharacterized protein